MTAAGRSEGLPLGSVPRRAGRAAPRAAAVEAEPAEGRGGERLRRTLLVAAAALVAAATFLPLWGMTLVSVQYPEGLRMVVYPTRIAGDVAEINVLNHYIGMAEISDAYFAELHVIPALFALIAIAALGAAFVRRVWTTALPLLLMGATAAYGFWSMRHRLYQFGHDLDPRAAIDIEPFTPPMFGEHTIAQFGTYSYFSWGTYFPVLAGALVALALWLDLKRSRTPMLRNAMLVPLAGFLLVSGGCGRGGAAAATAEVAAPSAGDREFAALTAAWTAEQREACARELKETLGTRDLVEGALAGVSDPQGKATAELEDARHWKAAGDSTLAAVRPQLQAGACDGTVQVALEEAVQFYVKAGTSAVQAGQIAGS